MKLYKNNVNIANKFKGLSRLAALRVNSELITSKCFMALHCILFHFAPDHNFINCLSYEQQRTLKSMI